MYTEVYRVGTYQKYCFIFYRHLLTFNIVTPTKPNNTYVHYYNLIKLKTLRMLPHIFEHKIEIIKVILDITEI